MATQPQQTSRPSGREAHATAGIVSTLRGQIERMTEDAVREIFSGVPAYETTVDRAFIADVREHVREHYEALLASLERGQPVTPEDLLFVRRHAADRVGRISVADFIHAFQVGQHVVLDATLGLAVDDRSRRAVLSLVSLIARYFDVVMAHAAEVYLESEQLLASTGERVRRDLLEDLLAGQPPAPGPALDAARAAGLELDAACIVIAARPTTALDDAYALRAAATALARATGRTAPPLAVVRHDEIVVIPPALSGDGAGRDAASVAERLSDSQKRLERGGVPLAVGMSTVHDSLAGVADAYREAVTARDRMLPRPGVVALPAMTMFDYLTSGNDGTARRMIPPAIERFVREDLASGGVLVETLHAYAAADLNVTEAAENLHVHVNTARYRLGRIAERTGCDLRHVNDLIELLIATRLASGAGER